MRDELLDYYERELVFLRKMGADFAKKYPKVAARLLIDEEKVEDPHVERLLEAFAFLAARIRLKLDDELPEITEAFINVLYPHFLAPLPSMAVCQFVSGSPKVKASAAQKLKKGSRLYSKPVDGTPCRFTTIYDVDLPPIEIYDAELESPAPPNAQGKLTDAHIRISMRCFGDAALSELKDADSDSPINSLRFFLNGDSQLVFPLYELIMNHATKVEIVPKEVPILEDMNKTITNVQLKQPDPVVLPTSAIKAVGFEPDEAMIPFSNRSFPGYRLLTEYFSFPYKFLFFEINGFSEAARRGFGSNFDVLIHLKDLAPPKAPLTEDTFVLGCSPVINLFRRTADPIYLSQQKYEYRVIPDIQSQGATEIYSIDEVFTTDPVTNEVKEFSPFYSTRHSLGRKGEHVFWYGDRRDSQREGDNGTEMHITLVDSDFRPTVPADEVITVKCTCTNRDLPARLPFGNKQGDFEVEGAASVSRVRCLTKPTETIRPPRHRGAQWRLISHLSLNYLSLIENKDGVPEALQEILELYNYGDTEANHRQILGIKNIDTKRVVRKIGDQIGTGFVRGTEVSLEFDEDEYVGSGLFVFASVLERFLALYSSLNSFSQFVMKTSQREGVVKRWPPRTGDRVLI